jgi:hypothetical protein
MRLRSSKIIGRPYIEEVKEIEQVKDYSNVMINMVFLGYICYIGVIFSDFFIVNGFIEDDENKFNLSSIFEDMI